MSRLYVLLIVLLMPSIAFADGEVPSIGEFMDAIGNKHWPLVVALGLTIVVWVIRNFVKDKVPTKYLPYLTLAIAVLSSTSARIIQAISNDVPWWQGLIQGILEGATIGWVAMGQWSSGVKKLSSTQPKE